MNMNMNMNINTNTNTTKERSILVSVYLAAGALATPGAVYRDLG